MSEKKKQLLDEIGMSWDRFEDKWEIGFNQAKKYREEIGDINFVSPDYEGEDNFNLNRWLHTQRERNRNNKLSDERKTRLEELGFKWSVHEAFWEKGYSHALSYIEENGNLKVPNGYECEDGFKLRSWVVNQKSRYKKGTLTDEQIEKLKKIGCI